MWEDALDATNWRKVVAINHAEFYKGTPTNKSKWKMMVFITRGDGRGSQGIGIVEVLWKTITGLLNQNFASEIGFHGAINGLQAGSGTGTAYPKAKLLQQIMATREAVLHEISLELQKYYNTLC